MGQAVAFVPPVCGTEADSVRLTYHISEVDTIRALLVFAKFPDADDGTPCDTTAWPSPGQVPTWAADLFDEEASALTTGTLSHYYDLVSDEQHLVLGGVYDSVVDLDSTIVHYATTYEDNKERLQRINTDVMAKLVSAWDDSLLTYDENGDEYLDVLCVFFRRGVSDSLKPDLTPYRLDPTFNAMAGTGPTDTTWFFTGGDSILTDPTCGLTLFPYRVNNGGVVQVRHQRYVFEHFIHEYGHHLKNVVGAPILSPAHWDPVGPYGAMDGTQTGFTFYSAFMLDELGWIEPIEIDSTVNSSSGDTTIVLSAVPDQGAYAKILTRDEKQYFMLELRNADCPYVSSPQGAQGCAARLVDHSGLLITHVFVGGVEGWMNVGVPSAYAPELEPEIATGMFASDGYPDPVYGQDEMQTIEDTPGYVADASTDLFKPGNVNVFSPYSNPSTNLYEKPIGWTSRTDEQTVFSGITIICEEWVGGGDDSMRVRIHFDEGDEPSDGNVIDFDTTWDGLVQLTGDVVVDSSVVLTVAKNSTVLARADHDRFEAGQAESLVEIVVEGDISMEGKADSVVTLSSSRDNDCSASESVAQGQALI
jgi:M6 family metalloprotease-like protein